MCRPTVVRQFMATVVNLAATLEASCEHLRTLSEHRAQLIATMERERDLVAEATRLRDRAHARFTRQSNRQLSRLRDEVAQLRIRFGMYLARQRALDRVCPSVHSVMRYDITTWRRHQSTSEPSFFHATFDIQRLAGAQDPDVVVL